MAAIVSRPQCVDKTCAHVITLAETTMTKFHYKHLRIYAAVR